MSEDTGLADLAEFLKFANEHPTGDLTFRIAALNTGSAVRRTVRALLRDAELAGATITSAEQRGLLDSVFTIHASGTGAQLTPLLAGLTCLAEQTETRRAQR